MATKTSSDFIQASEALRLLGVSRRTLMKLVETRQVGIRKIPNTLPSYSRADIERLIEQYTVAASA